MRHALALLALAGVTAIALPPIIGDDDPTCRPDLTHLQAPGCEVIAEDNSAARDPTGLWGRVECVAPTRQRRIDGHGDDSATASGRRQGNAAYRRIAVHDGDDYFGERCELGRNNHRPSRPTFALSGEGDHRAFFFSIRLPASFPLSGNAWQSVVQLKQSQPAANGSGSPQLGLHASDNSFSLHESGRALWSTPAPRNRWVRIVLAVNFSQDPKRGTARVLLDRNGDGDALDPRERSRVMHLATLKTETEGGGKDGIDPGEPIPAHLRVGIYHDDSYSCPPPLGCVVHFDNVQVVDLDDE
jgi:hypothetical protein